MRSFILTTTAAATLLASAAFTQQLSQGTTSIPDFSGFWGNPYLYGIEPPLSGPAPVVNKSRRTPLADADGRILPPGSGLLASNPNQLVGDYTKTQFPPARQILARRALSRKTLATTVAARHAPRARPEEGAAPKKFAVVNAVLIFNLERWPLAKSLIFLARPERFELPTPRFVVWCSGSMAGLVEPLLAIPTPRGAVFADVPDRRRLPAHARASRAWPDRKGGSRPICLSTRTCPKHVRSPTR
jgi:hypothetical protein